MPTTGELVIDNKNFESYTPLSRIMEAPPRREESSDTLTKSFFFKPSAAAKGSLTAVIDESIHADSVRSMLP